MHKDIQKGKDLFFTSFQDWLELEESLAVEDFEKSKRSGSGFNENHERGYSLAMRHCLEQWQWALQKEEAIEPNTIELVQIHNLLEKTIKGVGGFNSMTEFLDYVRGRIERYKDVDEPQATIVEEATPEPILDENFGAW